MRAVLFAAMLGLILLADPCSALAQSGPAFDCARAEHEIEELVCKDAELSAKDRKMADVFKQAIAVMEKIDAGGPEAIKELKTTQRGWIGGRNECWKESDKRRCTIDSYDRRMAFLQARYFLVESSDAVFYDCSDNSQIVATFIPTEPPSVRLERGDSLEIGILSPAASGTRYDADFGIFFWTKNNEALVAWPQQNEFNCLARK